MNNVVHISSHARQLRQSLDAANVGRSAGHVGAVMQQRQERRTVERKLQLVDDMQLQARRDLTKLGICWKCMEALDARRFGGWAVDNLPAPTVMTHGGCL